VPRDIFNIDKIVNWFPDAKIIVCVRDLRGFLLSYKGKWRITAEDDIERLRKIYHPVITSFLWKASTRLIPVIKHKIIPKNLLVMRYEDLVKDTEQTVRKMCEVVEEDFEPQMLSIKGHNSSHPTHEEGIFSTSVERWKSQLSAEEIAIPQYIARRELEELGYERISTSVSPVKVAGIYLSTPYTLVAGLYANRKKRGPLLSYLMRRTRALMGS
jgi:hypothetical protein